MFLKRQHCDDGEQSVSAKGQEWGQGTGWQCDDRGVGQKGVLGVMGLLCVPTVLWWLYETKHVLKSTEIYT